MTNQNRLLINNCYQITYFLKINRQIYSAPPPSAISSALFTKNPRHLIRIPEILSLSLFPVTKTSFSINLSTNICLPFKSLLRAYFDFRTKTQRPSPPLHPKVQRRTSLNTPLKDLFFARKSCRFYIPKMHLKNANGCSVCAWLLTSGGLRPAMRLRRIAPPRASRSGADQAHTLSLTNRPLNRLLSLCKITIAGNTFARRKARRGAEPSPLIRSGSAAAFPRRVRVFHIRLHDFRHFYPFQTAVILAFLFNFTCFLFLYFQISCNFRKKFRAP